MADETPGRILWARLTPGEILPCEAPRHEGEPARPAAAWRVVLLEQPDEEPEFYSMCSRCVETIAADLGMTAEEGAARL